MKETGNAGCLFKETPPAAIWPRAGFILLSFLIALQCRRLQLFAHIDDFFIVAVNILPDGVHIIKNIIKQVVNRLSFAHIMKCRPVYIFEEE